MKNTISKFALLSIVALNFAACRANFPLTNSERSDSLVVRRSSLADTVRIERSRFVFVKGDSVLVRDTLFRDRVRIVNRCDTVFRDRDVYVERPVPFIPPFYKILVRIACILIFFAVVFVVILLIRHRFY